MKGERPTIKTASREEAGARSHATVPPAPQQKTCRLLDVHRINGELHPKTTILNLPRVLPVLPEPCPPPIPAGNRGSPGTLRSPSPPTTNSPPGLTDFTLTRLPSPLLCSHPPGPSLAGRSDAPAGWTELALCPVSTWQSQGVFKKCKLEKSPSLWTPSKFFRGVLLRF